MPVEGVALPSEVAASIETDFSADFNMARRIQKTMRQKLKKPSKKHHPFKAMFYEDANMETQRVHEETIFDGTLQIHKTCRKVDESKFEASLSQKFTVTLKSLPLTSGALQ